jgi:long-chain acyl-CoA synthetase
MKARVGKITGEVNQRLLPCQKIGRPLMPDEPMEMTSTKKIKRGDN